MIRCSAAGSLRRHREVIGDIDLLASSKQPAEVIEFFTSQPGILKVIAKGETKASVLLEGGIQSDLRVVSDAEYPFALMYFTGSKEHNIVMRQRAIERGLRLNEYGLFRSKEETRDPKLLVTCRTEEEIFEKLGLHYIPPELREDMGEIRAGGEGAAAAADRVDGPEGLAAQPLHLERRPPAAGGDRHSRCASWAWLTGASRTTRNPPSRPTAWTRRACGSSSRRSRRSTHMLANEGTDFRLLTGTEVDILKDGTLDFPDDLLAELDVVVASMHQSFNQTEAETTQRLIGAAQNPLRPHAGPPDGPAAAGARALQGGPAGGD